jgi:hypothetical protein
MVNSFILVLWTIRFDYDNRKIKATTVVTPKYVVGLFLDQALPLDCTRIQLRSRSGVIPFMIINIIKTEPEIKLEDPQRTQLRNDSLMNMLVYGCVETRLSIGTYQKMRHTQLAIAIIVSTHTGYRQLLQILGLIAEPLKSLDTVLSWKQ